MHWSRLTVVAASLATVQGLSASSSSTTSRWPSGLDIGVDYYPSQWPEELWEPDIAAMRDLNVSYVRVNEFDWAILEPTEGQYNFTVLDKTIDLLAQYGLKAIIGTPTASPPNWLMDKYDVAFVDVTNSTYVFGSRRYYSFSSFDFRNQSQKITTVLAQRYGTNPTVVGWQIDNELGCHDTTRSYDHNAIARFRTWLQTKYGTIDALNTAQGRVFWSNQYASFDDVLPPYHEVYTTNDLHTLDWHAFSSDMLIDFSREQADILRQLAPTQAITTNFQMDFLDFDHYRFSREVGIDIAFFDAYPLAGPSAMSDLLSDADLATTLRTGLPDYQALHHALYRGIAGAAYENTTAGLFGVMEMEPGVLNWNTYRVSPWQGMVRLWSLETFAASGDVVSYFRWRQVPYAQEQTLSGLHVSDGSRDEGYGEVSDVVFQDLPVVREALLTTTNATSPAHESQADVALVFDYASVWVWKIEPYSGSWDVSSASYTGTILNYFDLVYTFYSALRRLGLSIDVVGPDQPLDNYKMIVVPSAPILPNITFPASGSDGPAVVFGPRSAALTENFAYAPGLQPAAGPLRDNLPMRVTRIETPPSYANSGVEYAGANYSIVNWEETVECTREGQGNSTVTVTSTSAHRMGKPAACANSDSNWHYVGFNPPVEFLVAYLGDLAAAAGLNNVAGVAVDKTQDLGSSGVRLLRRDGLVWAFNYGTEAVAAPAVSDGAVVVVGGEDGTMIPAAGVRVWKMS